MRDFSVAHAFVNMNGPQPCISCVFAEHLGWCKMHKTEVAAFDGCDKHQLKTKTSVV